MKKFKKFLIWLVGIILVVLIAGAAYLHFSAYQPSTAANQAVKVAAEDNQETFFKAKQNKLTVIFYPGALVTPNSYAIWAKKVAQAGYTVKIVHFPLNMAFFKVKAADKVVNSNENYVVGGHSLGGAMAARYAHQSDNPHLKGIFFLGAYPDEKGRLDQKKLDVLSITASRDGVLNWSKYRQGKKYLPKTTEYYQIKGGNHGGFGSYGQQKGDRKATISNGRQQTIIAKKLIAWLRKIK
ncbi:MULTISPECIES: alpha/beta hydrolase [Lactobacillus]|uniref:Alpha/beta hydrolase n=1 Tax=Lactobacillus xujianguonis TaxID=2495899 RepID=A0A437SV68_9LACO|nr:MULTISPECIES: alpha/beta hydrolase [Lactobacillus]RVU70804.1 alpha/beta hydrolase [Lactobacillus xujianguonis]RVU77004.1 alpha/beta hydrolase [Lactobacillus xujianguonis]